MEQLKIGDKVKILWEKTNYVATNLYNRNGVILGVRLNLDVSSGKVYKLYSVGDIISDDEKYTLYFTKEELVKVPEITKKLEPKLNYDGLITYHEGLRNRGKIMEGLYGSKFTFFEGILVDMEKTILDNTLPTKVVFDKNKRKTTLLFGDKPYKHKVSGIAHDSDTFDTSSGFFIQLAKNILKDKWKDKLKMWEYIAKNDFNIVKTMIFNFVLTHLKEELGMSFRQLDKLSEWNFDKPLTFEINGIKHTIEVEHKLNHVKEIEKTKEK